MMLLLKSTYLAVFATLSGFNGSSSVIALPTGCCSLNYKDCISWCGNTKNSCLKCDHHDGLGWLENGSQNKCRKRWKGCGEGKRNSCCGGLTCRKDQNDNHLMCLPINPIGTKEPTAQPTGALFQQDDTSLTTVSPPVSPSAFPSKSPTSLPSETPSETPSVSPSASPSSSPSESPSVSPSESPSVSPSTSPSASPSLSPSSSPSKPPSESPSTSPSSSPSTLPSTFPSVSPSSSPSESPSASPSASPSENPTSTPSTSPTSSPEPCCSLDFKNCINWCGPTKKSCSNCNHHDGVGWLSNGPPKDKCLPRWKGCENKKNACCDGLTCKADADNYLMCLPINPIGTKEPTAQPTDAPTFVSTTTKPTSVSPTSKPTATPTDLLSPSPTTTTFEPTITLEPTTYLPTTTGSSTVSSTTSLSGSTDNNISPSTRKLLRGRID